jgi:threonine aldolase
MKPIDLRSDTVTLPTPEMRDAMFRAEVGDDVHHDDPTTNRLERMAAEKMGKEDALFVASGTMANLVAVLTHSETGDRVIVGSEAHIHHYEGEGVRRLAGVDLTELPNDAEGQIDPAGLDEFLWESKGAPITLVCLENTHMRCGGVPLTVEHTAKVAAVAHERGVPLHLDGARIFDAAIALGVPADSLACDADSVMFCLSKGLAAPVGSVLCGSAEFIVRARQSRRWVGGGMRQVGILAAAGIVALDTMIERLPEDHVNARLLADGLATIGGISIDPAHVRTNIVIFTLEDGEERDFLGALSAAGVLALPLGPDRVRMVTHYGIERADIEKAVRIVRRVMRKRGQTAPAAG